MRRSEIAVLVAIGMPGCAVPLHDDGGAGGSPSSDAAVPLPVAKGCMPFHGLAERATGGFRSASRADGTTLIVLDDAVVDGSDVPSLTLQTPPAAVVSDCLASASVGQAGPTSALPRSFAPMALLAQSGTTSLFYAQQGTGYGVVALGTTPGMALWTSDRPAYGSAAVEDAGDVYVYGCLAAGSLDADCYVARAPAGSIASEAAYAYYVGGGHWSTQVDDAWPMTSAGTQIDVAWIPAQSRWLMAYVPPLGVTITVRSGLTPSGPWSSPIALANCDLADADMFCNGVHLHTSFASPPGTIAISYAIASLSSDAPARMEASPDEWWPRLVALPLPALP